MRKKSKGEHERICSAVAKWLKGEGYSVFKGIKLGRYIADLVGVKSREDTIAVEVKPGNKDEIRKGLGQAQTYLDWVHKVYLAIPMDFIDIGEDITKHTNIGLLTNFEKDFVAITKEAKEVKPIERNLTQLLSKTTGFCWICGRTFNIVPPNPDGFLIAHKDFDQKLYKGITKALRTNPRTKNIWVQICMVCTNIQCEMIASFLRTMVKGKNRYSDLREDYFMEYGFDLEPLLRKLDK